MNKKVYFAGSIRGGRADAALYQRIIAFIEQTDMVLTEQVGDLTRSLKELVPGQDQQIYQDDMARLASCDIVIADATAPSLGVGYELASAERLGKETHVFYRSSDVSLSAMIKGDSYFKLHPYTNEEELKQEISKILAE